MIIVNVLQSPDAKESFSPRLIPFCLNFDFPGILLALLANWIKLLDSFQKMSTCFL